jgi:hypothetical protein
MNLDGLDVSSYAKSYGRFTVRGDGFPVLEKGTWARIRKGDLTVYAGYVTRSSPRYLEVRDWFYSHYVKDLLVCGQVLTHFKI